MGNVTKIVGLVQAKFFVLIIDPLNLEANTRSAKTGAITDAIQETISNTPELFPFMSKGVLLASSRYERLERNRIRIDPANLQIEGILDGGHNTLAIGLYILGQTLEYHGESLSKSAKNWDTFKSLWKTCRNNIESYLHDIQKGYFDTLQALLGKRKVNGKMNIYWKQPPMSFLQDNFMKIVKDYMGNLELCNYDPQKVGKDQKIYDDALKTFKMSIAGLL